MTIDWRSPFICRDGSTVEFRFELDVDPPNRGFVVDEMAAFIGDEKVGYLRVEYLGSDRFDSFYPTILHYLHQIGGKIILPFDKPTHPIEAYDGDELRRIAESLGAYRIIRDRPASPIVDGASFMAWFEAGWSRYGSAKFWEKEFAEFKTRIDFPFVSFVNLTPNEKRGVVRDSRGLGIGMELYRRAALALDEKAMVLHSSTLQSDSARRVWRRMEDCGWTMKVGERYAIDVAALKEPQFLV